jgi:phage I-like protein
MNPPILNRESKLPDDGWYDIETPGEHLNKAAGVVQKLDGESFTAIANRFEADRVAAGENFSGLLIDRDHFSLNTSLPSDALGWLMDVRNQDGRLQGKVDWTTVGKPLVDGKVFKFFSTVYDNDPTGVTKIGTRKVGSRTLPLVRPTKIDRLALTNDPNNKGGKPISNRSGNSSEAEINQPEKPMKNVNTKLGLAEDAPEASTVEAVQKILNRATTAEGQVTALTTERDTLLAAQVETDLTTYSKVIKNREAVKKQLLANRAGTLELLESLVVKPEAERITNRSKAGSPASETEAGAGDGAAVAQKITNRAHELKGNAPGRSFDSCWVQAQREITASSNN